MQGHGKVGKRFRGVHQAEIGPQRNGRPREDQIFRAHQLDGGAKPSCHGRLRPSTLLSAWPQAVAIDQTQTRMRNPPTSVPSSKPTLTKRLSRARTLPSWFIVAPHRNRRLTWSRMVVVLASPTSSRNVSISDLSRLVLLIKPHLWRFDGEASEYWWSASEQPGVSPDRPGVANRFARLVLASGRCRTPALFGRIEPTEARGSSQRMRSSRQSEIRSFRFVPWSEFNGGGISSDDGGVKAKFRRASPQGSVFHFSF